MRNTVCTFVFLTFFMGIRVQQVIAQKINAADIEGIYWTPEKDGKIKIYESGGKYYGKIIEGKNPNRLDAENPNPDLRSRKVVGMVFLEGFEWDEGDEEWDGGKIYDPDTGNTYDSYMWFEDGSKRILNVKGYIGISLIGRTAEFERVQ